jgi:uncharacterized protein
MAAYCNGSGCARILVDGPNIDGVLGTVLGRRPRPQERPRWDRVKAYLDLLFRPAVPNRLFVVDRARIGDGAFGFIRALRSIGWRVLPATLVGRYPGNDDPVDESILDHLHDMSESPRLAAQSRIALLSHDHIFAEPLADIGGLGARVVVVGFREEFHPSYLELERQGKCELHDLEFDAGAFNVRLPRPIGSKF